MMRRLTVTLALCLAGCAGLDPYRHAPAAQRLQRDDAVADCLRRFQGSDALIDAAVSRDAQAARVPGFPYLRVDRPLARLSEDAGHGEPQAQAWMQALAALDDAGRRVELANAGGDAAAWLDSLAACRVLLAKADQPVLPALLAAAQVPDDYSTSQRLLGLYPLTRHAFAAGIRGWQRETLEEFAAHAAADTSDPRRRRYAALGQPDSLPALRDLPELGLPAIAQTALRDLIVRNAPHFAIATASDDDRPGALVWQSVAGEPLRIGVAIDQPVLYVRTDHTQFAGRWLLQLIYTLWFPARPPVHAFDVLAGRLDGLLWRVTLTEDGTPLVYDTIHPCGCYHLFIPTERVRARPSADGIDEGVFSPQTLRSPAPHGHLVLKVAAGTHALQGVEVEFAFAEESVPLTLRDDDQLRTLPLPGGGTRSAFAADGMIAGSERLERFYFWPMGVASAGQMRQWGRHATAFVGRRHFDDPTLIDRYFERLP